MTIVNPTPGRPSFLDGIPVCDPASVRVAVLMGGPSAEREVSLMSGRLVADALEGEGFAVERIDLAPTEVHTLAARRFDVAFIALHGTFGEDGQLQAELDRLGVLYTGSGAAASRLAMDKVAAKERFLRVGVPTPPWRVVERGAEAAALRACEELGPGVVVKPIDEGSSIGVMLCDGWDDCRRGLEEVFGMRRRAMIERWVRGRELTAGVLRREGLPIVEIVPAHAFYDYEAKYFDDATTYRADPPLPPGVELAVRRMAVHAHEALGCRDFSRVDFILPADGQPTALEVNTIPGFTSHSLLPKSAAAAGIGYEVLCRVVIELALARRGERTTENENPA